MRHSNDKSEMRQSHAKRVPAGRGRRWPRHQWTPSSCAWRTWASKSSLPTHHAQLYKTKRWQEEWQIKLILIERKWITHPRCWRRVESCSYRPASRAARWSAWTGETARARCQSDKLFENRGKWERKMTEPSSIVECWTAKGWFETNRFRSERAMTTCSRNESDLLISDGKKGKIKIKIKK